MREETIMITPTVLVLDREGDETFGFVTAWEGEGRALIVFRGPEDAFRFQQLEGLYTEREGYLVVSLTY